MQPLDLPELYAQNICVFICLLKDVEEVLSIHAVVSAVSPKSLGTDSSLKKSRKQEKNKPSEAIL